MTKTPRRSDPQGPVTPPSLGEIFEISARRRRSRYRVVQGTLAVLSVAGIGLALEGRLGNDVQGDPASSLPTPTSPPVSSESKTEEVPNSVTDDLDLESTVALDECLFVSTDEPLDPWLVAGREAYLATRIIPVEEVETLADEWVVDFEEVKALVGLAAQRDMRLNSASIDDAFEEWASSGYSNEQLAIVAQEWNVSTVSVKVVNLIGDPVLQTALEACGLEAPAS